MIPHDWKLSGSTCAGYGTEGAGTELPASSCTPEAVWSQAWGAAVAATVTAWGKLWLSPRHWVCGLGSRPY